MFKRTSLAALMLLSSVSSFAETSTGTLEVIATVQNVCAIGSATLDFGIVSANADPRTGLNSADKDAIAQVPVICTSGTKAKLTGGGSGLADVYSPRQMTNVLGSLPYEIYHDALGLKTLNTDAAAAPEYTGKGLPEFIPLYGKITGAAVGAAQPGAYADLVRLTLTYSATN